MRTMSDASQRLLALEIGCAAPAAASRLTAARPPRARRSSSPLGARRDRPATRRSRRRRSPSRSSPTARLAMPRQRHCGSAQHAGPARRAPARRSPMPLHSSVRRSRSASPSAGDQPSPSRDQPAGRHLVDDLGAARAPGAPCRRCGGTHRLRHLQVAGERGVLDAGGGARHGSAPRSCGRTQRYICASSSRARVAGDVDRMVAARCRRRTPRVGELVLQVADRELVAGDHARGEDHGVARAPARRRGCSPSAMRGQRGARLALAAGAEEQHLVARQVAGLLLRDQVGKSCSR